MFIKKLPLLFIAALFSLSARAAYFGTPLPIVHGGTATANRTLVDSSSDVAIDWQNHQLKTGPNASVNWASRFLADSSGTLTLDYSSKADLYLTATPLTTKGDIAVRGSSTVDRLPVGADGEVLTADSAQTLGVKWAASSGSGNVVSPVATKACTTVVDWTAGVPSINATESDGCALSVTDLSTGQVLINFDPSYTANTMRCVGSGVSGVSGVILTAQNAAPTDDQARFTISSLGVAMDPDKLIVQCTTKQ